MRITGKGRCWCPQVSISIPSLPEGYVQAKGLHSNIHSVSLRPENIF